MKKYILLLLTLISSSLILIGCSNNAQNKNINMLINKNINNMLNTIKSLDIIEDKYLTNANNLDYINKNKDKNTNKNIDYKENSYLFKLEKTNKISKNAYLENCKLKEIKYSLIQECYNVKNLVKKYNNVKINIQLEDAIKNNLNSLNETIAKLRSHNGKLIKTKKEINTLNDDIILPSLDIVNSNYIKICNEINIRKNLLNIAKNNISEIKYLINQIDINNKIKKSTIDTYNKLNLLNYTNDNNIIYSVYDNNSIFNTTNNDIGNKIYMKINLNNKCKKLNKNALSLNKNGDVNILFKNINDSNDINKGLKKILSN